MTTEPEEARDALKERYTRFIARRCGATEGEIELTFAEGSNNKALIDQMMLWYQEMIEDEIDGESGENPPEPDWKHGDDIEG